MNHSAGQYALGYSDAETQRLMRQAALYADFTEDLLRRAGLSAGMRVLDIGCGVGDVSLLAARLVGPSGSVVGVDRAGSSLEVARRRAAELQLENIVFSESELPALAVDGRFDALIGRFVLMYLKDVSAALRSLVAHLRPGGIVAFQEMDMSLARCVPETPLWGNCANWIIVDAFDRAGADTRMGSRLHAVYTSAGLPAPRMNLHAKVGGPDSEGPDYLAGVVASLLPVMERNGLGSAAEVDLPTLAERLRDDLRMHGAIVYGPAIIGAWTTMA